MKKHTALVLLLFVVSTCTKAMELTKKKPVKARKLLTKQTKQEDWTRSAPGPLNLDKLKRTKKVKGGSWLSARGKKVKQHRSYSLAAKPELGLKNEEDPREKYRRARSNSVPAILIPDKIPSAPLTPEVLPKTLGTSDNDAKDLAHRPKTPRYNAAQILISRKAKLLRNKYSNERSGRDSMAQMTAKELLGANGEQVLVANPSPRPSPRSEDTTTEESPRTEEE